MHISYTPIAQAWKTCEAHVAHYVTGEQPSKRATSSTYGELTCQTREKKIISNSYVLIVILIVTKCNALQTAVAISESAMHLMQKKNQRTCALTKHSAHGGAFAGLADLQRYTGEYFRRSQADQR